MTLSTPVLWVLLPLTVAAITALFYNRKVFGIVLTSVTAFSLSLLALAFPEEMVVTIGPLTMIFEESFSVLGRQVSIAYELLPFIALIYFMTGLWASSSNLPGVPQTFRPISLTMTALLTAALGVEPFLYAALLIEIAVLVSIPMLSPMGKKPQPGIIRYLTLETLAMPFILVAGWLLTGVEALPPDSPLVFQSAIVLGLGIALWLGVFPFHSWVPMVSEHSNPLATSFLLLIMPTTILVFSLNFLNHYTFLREAEALYTTLRTIGTLMIVLGGAWTAFQTNLKRALSFSVLTETGFSLLAIGLAAEGGLNWMVMLFPARALSFWLWGLLLTRIEAHTGSLDLENIQGLGRRYPLLSIGLLLAQLSVAGMPLLAEFPVKLTLLTTALKNSTSLGVWGFIGSLGLFLFTLRLLATLVSSGENETLSGWSISEKTGEVIPVVIAVLVLLVLGLFPHTLLAGITSALAAFGQLQ